MHNFGYALFGIVGVLILAWVIISLFRGCYDGNLYKVEKNRTPFKFYVTMIEFSIISLVLIAISLVSLLK